MAHGIWNRLQPRNRVSTIIFGSIPKFVKETRFLNPRNNLQLYSVSWTQYLHYIRAYERVKY